MGILSADTSYEAEAVQMDILRRLGPVVRLEQLAEATVPSWQFKHWAEELGLDALLLKALQSAKLQP